MEQLDEFSKYLGAAEMRGLRKHAVYKVGSQAAGGKRAAIPVTPARLGRHAHRDAQPLQSNFVERAPRMKRSKVPEAKVWFHEIRQSLDALNDQPDAQKASQLSADVAALLNDRGIWNRPPGPNYVPRQRGRGNPRKFGGPVDPEDVPAFAEDVGAFLRDYDVNDPNSPSGQFDL